MKSNSYIGAHVGWKVIKAFTVEAKRRGKPRRWLIERVLTAVALDDLFNATFLRSSISNVEHALYFPSPISKVVRGLLLPCDLKTCPEARFAGDLKNAGVCAFADLPGDLKWSHSAPFAASIKFGL